LVRATRQQAQDSKHRSKGGAAPHWPCGSRVARVAREDSDVVIPRE
jgi:hypothetical protein